MRNYKPACVSFTDETQNCNLHSRRLIRLTEEALKEKAQLLDGLEESGRKLDPRRMSAVDRINREREIKDTHDVIEEKQNLVNRTLEKHIAHEKKLNNVADSILVKRSQAKVRHIDK